MHVLAIKNFVGATTTAEMDKEKEGWKQKRHFIDKNFTALRTSSLILNKSREKLVW